MATVKVGGQALADGVLMRTSRAWAIARADGSVEVGSLAPNPVGGIPVLRILFSLVGALRLAVGRGMLRSQSGSARRLNRRFLAVLAGLEVAAYLAGRAMPAGRPHGWAGVVAVVVPWLVTLAVLRLATPGALWRYHGAEHKAVSAHEAGVDLADTSAVLRASRVHDRCGTNLVFVMLLLGLVLNNADAATGWAQVPVFLGLLGASAELVTLAAARPRWLPCRLLLAGGKALQRWVTTAEPTAAEQAVGCRALLACLAEHERLEAADQFEPLRRVTVAAA